jgi:hypothetical protein
MRRARRARPVDQRDGVLCGPLAVDREREDAVQEVQEVLNGLGRLVLGELCEHESLDTRAIDLVQRSASEERLQVAAQVAAVVLKRRALALHDVFEVLQVGLADGAPLRAGDHGLGGDPSSQLGLGLRACEPVGAAGASLGSQAALDAPPAHPPRAVVGLVPVGVEADVQSA